MPPGSLSPLQVRILRLLADIRPVWTLTGGAALAGFHTGHRRTRDLDLFWRQTQNLEQLPERVKEALAADGLQVETLQRGGTFHRFRVHDSSDVCVVDLVAEPSASLLPPDRLEIEGHGIAIDSRHEILVNKLCALLGRSELRDLVDVRELLARGEDLPRALRDAARIDGGFSPLTLAWVVRDLHVTDLARTLELDIDEASSLQRFRDELVQRLTAESRPDT